MTVAVWKNDDVLKLLILVILLFGNEKWSVSVVYLTDDIKVWTKNMTMQKSVNNTFDRLHNSSSAKDEGKCDMIPSCHRVRQCVQFKLLQVYQFEFYETIKF